MKYIVTQNEEGKEELFMFPKSIDHDCMAEVLSHIRSSSTGRWVRARRKPIAAGFTDGKKCVGRSETLDLDSRGPIDEALITV